MVSLQFTWQSHNCHFWICRFINSAFRNLISPDFSLRKMNTLSDANKVQRPWKHERSLCTVFANRVHVTATVQNVSVWASGSLMFEQRGHAQLLSLCHSEACRENKSTTEQKWHLASMSLFSGFLWPINTRCDFDIHSCGWNVLLLAAVLKNMSARLSLSSLLFLNKPISAKYISFSWWILMTWWNFFFGLSSDLSSL